ncbi:MAG: hypothetical protein ACE5G2_05925 [Candidatus Krumholzibacteriia bacterium]
MFDSRSFLSKTPLAFLVFLMACTCGAPVTAQQHGFGLGFLFGEPAGVNGKLWRGHDTALVGGLAWSFVDDGAADLYGDFVWHRFGLLDVDRGRLPLYVGVGARLQLDGGSRFGIRIPVGMNYLFETAPIDAFVEFVPLFDLAPETDWEFNAAVGFRYFFR